MSRATAVSSTVVASVTSATSVTVTVNGTSVTAVSPPSASVEAAVSVMSMSPAKFGGGVMVRPSKSAVVNVQVPSPLSVPAESTAPSGTPETTMERDSEPSTSVSAEPRSRLMAVSSRPLASWAVAVGASATAVTVTSSSAVVPPDVTESVKSTSESGGGVMVRSASCAAVTSALPLVMVMTSPPDISTAPSGISEMVPVVSPSG